MVKTKWDHFGSNFETLSVWITEKEKELNALETSSSAMDMQISQIKVTCSHVIFIIHVQLLRTTFLHFIKCCSVPGKDFHCNVSYQNSIHTDYQTKRSELILGNTLQLELCINIVRLVHSKLILCEISLKYFYGYINSFP